jgi:anti-anti-sigma factor
MVYRTTTVNGLLMEVHSDTPDEQATTVKVAGEIDVANADALRDVLELVCEPERLIVLDMEDVTFIDSSGVNALLKVLQQTSISHRGLVLQNPRRNVRMVLGVLGLEQTFGLDVVQFDEQSAPTET